MSVRTAVELAHSLERDYPQNALTQALAVAGHLCGSVNPSGDAVCARRPEHGVTAMRLPDGARTYVCHNTRADGTGEGWDA